MEFMANDETHPKRLSRQLSRRQILQQVGCAGAAVLAGGQLGGQLGYAADTQPASTQPASARPTSTRPAATEPATRPTNGSASGTASSGTVVLKSVVSDIRARQVVADLDIHEQLLREMIDEGVRQAVGAMSVGQAWNQLLRSDDIIGLKFNHIGEEVFNTTIPMATQLVQSLKDAGFSPDRIVLIEAPRNASRLLKTRPCPIGFSGPKVSFGSGEDQLSAVLQEVSAIINVPFLKTHRLAGMSCCLKNLSHALIRRPNLCHANACAPFVGDILALPQIRPKLKLHLVNALRALYDGGPLPEPKNLWPHSGVLVSTDPVACDFVALDILNHQRTIKKLPMVGDLEGHIPHVRSAAARDLGTDDQDYIDVQRPQLF